jgi:hypothetical protein
MFNFLKVIFKKDIVGYSFAILFTILEIVLIYLAYKIWELPPAILIPTVGMLTFFGVLIIVNLFSKNPELQKAEIRTAIAAALLVVYFFLLATTLFALPTNSSVKPGSGTDSIKVSIPTKSLDKSGFRGDSITVSIPTKLLNPIKPIISTESNSGWELLAYKIEKKKTIPSITDSPKEQTNQNVEPSEIESETESVSANELIKDLLSDYTSLIIVIVAFYFGGRSAEEIVKTLRGATGGNSNGNDLQNDPNNKKPPVPGETGEENK